MAYNAHKVKFRGILLGFGYEVNIVFVFTTKESNMANKELSLTASQNDKSNRVKSDILTDMQKQLEQSSLSINDKMVISELIEEIVQVFGEQITTYEELQHYLLAHSDTPNIDLAEAIEHFNKLTDQENESLYISWQNESDITTTYVENMADLGFRGEIDYVDFTEYLCFAVATLKRIVDGKVSELSAAVKETTKLVYMANSVTQQYKRLTYFWEMYERVRPKHLKYIDVFAPVLSGREAEINMILDETGERKVRAAIEQGWDDIHSRFDKEIESLNSSAAVCGEGMETEKLDLVDLWHGEGKSIIRLMMVKYYMI